MMKLALRSVLLAGAFAAVSTAGAMAAAGAPLPPRPGMLGPRVVSAAALHGAVLGMLPPGRMVDVYIHLRGQHENELERTIQAIQTPGSGAYGHYLTPEAFGRYFGADSVSYGRAIASLRAHGFVIDALPANRTDIEAHAPAATVAAYFATPIELRVERGRTFFANRYEPQMPADLPAEAVSGLDDYFVHHPMFRVRPRTVVGGYFSWGPADLAAGYDLNPLYKATPVLDGKGVTIANATSGAATAGDLAKFQAQFHLPAAKLVTTPIGGPVNTAGNGESTLDVDSALSVAREATFDQVVAYNTSNHDFDLVYSYIANTLGKTVHVVTTSWGTCERDMKGTSSLTIDEKLFAQAAAEGQAWFSASGDNGTDDCQDGGSAVSVDYPGSSPYVTSVGGTNVKGSSAGGVITGWLGETTWQYANSNGASGGGKSILYKKPAYQQGRTPNDGVRDVPDVALLADDVNDGVFIVQNGNLQAGWGGTSEAAPQWAGLLAIVVQKKGNVSVADPHTRLYALAATSLYHTIFHDITQGNNGVKDPYGTFPGYNAAPNFDLTTGLGSYIGAALVNAY